MWGPNLFKTEFISSLASPLVFQCLQIYCRASCKSTASPARPCNLQREISSMLHSLSTPTLHYQPSTNSDCCLTSGTPRKQRRHKCISIGGMGGHKEVQSSRRVQGAVCPPSIKIQSSTCWGPSCYHGLSCSLMANIAQAIGLGKLALSYQQG